MSYLRLGLFLALISCTQMALSQQDNGTPEKKPSLRDRMVFGGGITVDFRGQRTLLGASPMLGYKVTDNYIAGLNLSYLYYSDPSLKSHTYATGIFNRYMLYDVAFLHAELEYGSQAVEFESFGEVYRDTYTYPAFLVGGGYQERLGGSAGIGIYVLYDVLEDPNSPYNGPIIRGGLMLGF